MNQYKQRAVDYIDNNKDIFVDVSDKIWEYAELSLKEYRSMELYCDVLEKGGFKVEKELCGVPTAFSGTFGSGKPVIGILGEFDALSGLSQKEGSAERCEIISGGNGHGCGHNMLGAGALAAAFALKDYLQRSGKEGTVIFFGCPGEEGGAGKAFMARDNAWKSLDAALTWHPGDLNAVTSGSNISSIQIEYRFTGVASHAAGDPESGRSALDAVELMNVGVQFLREHMSDDARVHYSIIDAGGLSPNVVQPKARVLYMIRERNVREALKLVERVNKIAEGAALMTETSLSTQFIDGTADVLPNFFLEKIIYDNFEQVGVPNHSKDEIEFGNRLTQTYDSVQSLPSWASQLAPEIREKLKKDLSSDNPFNDFLMPLFSNNYVSKGSTDVGDVSWQTPTAQFTACTVTKNSPGHSWQNVSCGKTSIGHKGMLCAGKVLAATAIELFENPELIKKATAEFTEKSAGGYVCPIPADAKPIAID